MCGISWEKFCNEWKEKELTNSFKSRVRLGAGSRKSSPNSLLRHTVPTPIFSLMCYQYLTRGAKRVS